MELKKIVRTGEDRALKDFGAALSGSGFVATKRRLWVRLRDHWAEFLYVERHGGGYAAMNASVDFDIKSGVRVLNDFPALGLNGPHADAATVRDGDYHLRFNAKNPTTYERCISDMVRFVAERVEPWFVANCTKEALTGERSVLQDRARELLRNAAEGQTAESSLVCSRTVLGLK